jgi:predicted O-methyltransferase YrrM
MLDFPNYGTHIPVICRVFTELETSGDVLELGCGNYSTPLLHEFCIHRKLVSLDSDVSWAEKFAILRTPQHIIRAVDSWKTLEEYNSEWDVVLVDNSPAQYREYVIEKLANKAKLLIAHDTENMHRYKYYRCLPKFRFMVNYTRYSKTTTVVSNFIDVSKWW